MQSQRVIEDWVQLYNRLRGASYRVTSWCVNSSQTVCRDLGEEILALEHALVTPLQKEKTNSGCSTVRVTNESSLLRNELERKLSNLMTIKAKKRILLLESDSVAGTIEDKYASAYGREETSSLINRGNEIWALYTAVLASDNVIFTNRIYPVERDDRSLCSLNVLTGEFWQLRPEGLMM